MLDIIINNSNENGTVYVQSQAENNLPSEKNRFILDYEDYLLLKFNHFYQHRNGSFITRRGEKQYNLNRWLAWKRGYFDLNKHPKIMVKFFDGDKQNFSKNNLVYYFNKSTEPFTSPQTLPRGVMYDIVKKKFKIAIPYKSMLIVKDEELFDYEFQAILAYRTLIKKVKKDEATAWI